MLAPRAASGLTLALLFLASVLPSNAQSATEVVEGAGAGGGAAEAADGVRVIEPVDAIEVVYEVRLNLSLDCSGLADSPGGALEWRVNGTLLAELPEPARKRLRASAAALSVDGRSHEADWGNYSCAAGGRVRAWRVRAATHAKLPADTNVVEGQKLKLTCRLLGKPYPPVVWSYAASADAFNGTHLLNGTELVNGSLEGRVTLSASEQGVPGAELALEPARRGDAGWYQCAPAGPRGGAPAVSRLRVKDMYAALWPFLGICAEVFVLCAIILVYEKRRTKPELDDSDTDNHDQKKS